MTRLAARIDAGLVAVAEERVAIQQQVADLRLVAETLEPQSGRLPQRRAQFRALQERFAESEVSFHGHLSKLMASWAPGLFVGGKAGNVPWDNLDSERWFRLPKGHERRIHGHQHAGVRLVQEGATLMPALDAHKDREEPYKPEELIAFKDAKPPKQEQEAMHRRKVMRRARSKKQRPILLAELERRYRDAP